MDLACENLRVSPCWHGLATRLYSPNPHRFQGRLCRTLATIRRTPFSTQNCRYAGNCWVLIHVDPKSRDRLRCAVPLVDQQGTLADHFGGAMFFAFAIVYPDGREAKPAEIVSNPHRQAERAKGIRVAEWLVERKTDVVVVRDGPAEKGPIYVLGDAAVAVHHTDAVTLAEALAEVAQTDGTEVPPDSREP